jgi:hypothetical protein
MPSGKRQAQKNFTHTVSKSGADDIFLLFATDKTNQPAWYYIRATKTRKKLLPALAGKKNLNLADYGEVIISGYGETVPDPVKEMMRTEYGYAD